MKKLNIAEFLEDLSWSDTVRHKLRIMADRDDLLALSAHHKDGKLTATAWTSWPRKWPAGTIAIWCKRPMPDRTLSKTQQALELVRQGANPHAAAAQLGITATAVYRAFKRSEGKQICPCCGQVVRDGFKVQSDAPTSA